jgi:hypothetical protein
MVAASPLGHLRIQLPPLTHQFHMCHAFWMPCAPSPCCGLTLESPFLWTHQNQQKQCLFGLPPRLPLITQWPVLRASAQHPGYQCPEGTCSPGLWGLSAPVHKGSLRSRRKRCLVMGVLQDSMTKGQSNSFYVHSVA